MIAIAYGTVMQSLIRIVFLSTLLIVYATYVTANSVVTEDLCFQINHDNSVDACEFIAENLSDTHIELRALGYHLEAIGHYKAAVTVYKSAIKQYPKDKLLLKGLIRSRAEIRGQQLFAKLTAKESPKQKKPTALAKTENIDKTSDCWRLRWQDALQACQKQLKQTPNDGYLHERLADILRSMGRRLLAPHTFLGSHTDQQNRRTHLQNTYYMYIVTLLNIPHRSSSKQGLMLTWNLRATSSSCCLLTLVTYFITPSSMTKNVCSVLFSFRNIRMDSNTPSAICWIQTILK